MQHLLEGPQVAAATASEPRRVHIVLGNESCDMDSAVCAVTLAYIYGQRYQDRDYVPILNVPRIDYRLKTEVVHMFNKFSIEEDMLVFRDDLPLQLPGDIRVVLVDHHISHLAPLLVEILDHRPRDAQLQQLIGPAVDVEIEPLVGSCATLVAERYLAQPEPRLAAITELLHAAILLDTINFDAVAKRFCERDLTAVIKLEQLLQQPDEPCGAALDDAEHQRRRKILFDQLVAARADISELSLCEVLRKDMKLLQTEQHLVPFAGIPILVREFIEKPNAEAAIRSFAGDSHLLVMLGMFVPPPDENGVSPVVQRDVALITLTGQTLLLERARLALVNCQSPPLELRAHEVDSHFMGGFYLRQYNIQATRKHILPLIERVVREWETTQRSDDVYFFKEKPKLGLS